MFCQLDTSQIQEASMGCQHFCLSEKMLTGGLFRVVTRGPIGHVLRRNVQCEVERIHDRFSKEMWSYATNGVIDKVLMRLV